MQAVLRKWGNSTALRLPAAMLEAAQLRVDQAVEIREEGGRLVIEAVRTPLDALVAAITDENRHEAAEFGPPQGREAW